jgi:hypothetical protein
MQLLLKYQPNNDLFHRDQRSLQQLWTSSYILPIPVSWSIDMDRCILFWKTIILTRRVSPVEQELLTLPEHLSSPPVFSGVRVSRSLVLYVCFVDRCLSFCTFPFGHCVVCSSSIYEFWLPPFGIFKLFLMKCGSI